MQFTKEIKSYFKNSGKTYRSYAIPTVLNSQKRVVWNNNDEDFQVELDLVSNELTGRYYEWDEDQQDWIDGEIMKDSELLKRIHAREFVLG